MSIKDTESAIELDNAKSHILSDKSSFALLQEVFEIGLICVAFYALLKWFPRGYFYDGNVRLQTILSVFQHGMFTDTGYSYIGPLFSFPLFLVDKFNNSHLWWMKRYNVVLCMVVFPIVYTLLRKRMNASVLRGFFLIFLLISLYSNQYRYFGGETFTALLAGMGILVAVLVTELGGWLAVAIGVANTPASLIAAGLISLRYMIHRRRLRYVLVVLGAAGLVGFSNWLARGNALNGGYAHQSFNTPVVIGLFSLFFASGKGLFFFLPALFLPLKNRLFQVEGENREKVYLAYKLWMYFVAGLVLIYASWWAWDGGWFWGPRFFLFASIPASFVIAVYLRNPSRSFIVNLFILLLFAYTLWVALAGTLFDQGTLNTVCVVNNYSQYYLCNYQPQYSVLWAPLAQHWPLPQHAFRYIALCLVVAIYLSLPTLIAMARQVQTKLQGARANFSNMKVWLMSWRP